MPSPERFNWAVDRLNEWMTKDKISLRFKRVDEIIPDEEFARRFAENGELPLASEVGASEETQGAVVHDAAFHTGAVFIPEPVKALAQRQARVLHQFRDFVTAQNPELFRRARR